MKRVSSISSLVVLSIGVGTFGVNPHLYATDRVYVTLVVDDDDPKVIFDNIQDAIDSIDWDEPTEILIMPGIYTDIHQQVIDPNGLVLWIHSSAGANVTIIDGENIRRCVFARTEETNETIFEGLTFTNGYAQHGAGMWASTASPKVIDCTFEDNVSYGFGGGMYVSNNASPEVSGCTFANNSALDGGAIKNYGDEATFTDCVISNNSAENGGGIQNYGATAVYEDCVIVNNQATEVGGGIHNVFGSNPTFINCNIDSNTAVIGGGVRNEATSTPSYINCKINGNTAEIGGGVENQNASPSFLECEILNNVGSDVGGMATFLKSNPTLENTIVCGNTVIEIQGPYTDIAGNTICDDACGSDLDGDGVVDVHDLLLVIAAWGNQGGLEDINQDGIVGVADLLVLIAEWGVCS